MLKGTDKNSQKYYLNNCNSPCLFDIFLLSDMTVNCECNIKHWTNRLCILLMKRFYQGGVKIILFDQRGIFRHQSTKITEGCLCLLLLL